MLKLKPTCEQCNKALPPDSTEAMICSYECTYCRECVTEVLLNVCPNCAGGFWARPVRPQKNWKNGNYLGSHPASDEVVFAPVDAVSHAAFAADIKGVKPEQR